MNDAEREFNKYRTALDAVMDVWTSMHGITESHSQHYREFADLIGYPSPEDGMSRYIVDIENPEIRAIIDKLNGPYTEALLKVLEIKRAGR